MLLKYESSPLRFLRDEVDKLFEQSFVTSNSQWLPEVDIVENESELILTAEMAGLTQNDIDLSIENNELILKGKKLMEESSDVKHYHRMERRYGSFTRTFKLPKIIDSENIQASFVDGVLKVVLTKKESVKARKIEVLGAITEPKTLSAKASS